MHWWASLTVLALPLRCRDPSSTTHAFSPSETSCSGPLLLYLWKTVAMGNPPLWGEARGGERGKGNRPPPAAPRLVFAWEQNRAERCLSAGMGDGQKKHQEEEEEEEGPAALPFRFL